MNAAPNNPKIYHITHVDSLASIAAAGWLCSDARRIRDGAANVNIGMTEIKRRRLEELTVSCHPETKVGEYVPFYFCPRSIMLYIISCRNHPGLAYTGGQGPIVHLEADLYAVIRWAKTANRRWAFTKSNAGAFYSEFYNRLDQLDQINWAAVAATDFRDPLIKEGKQAEFLVHEEFPWRLVERIGVMDRPVAEQVAEIIARTEHQPELSVQRGWYY